MNQKFIRMFAIGMEVGAAYSNMIEGILADPNLSQWKYILTLEEDNMPPPDGLLKLYENMDKYDAIGGLYWTKGELGQPMIYGNPHEMPLTFVPQLPMPETVQECNGLGMAVVTYTLFVKRKLIEGVAVVYAHGNDAFFYPTKPVPVTYQNFLSGFRPLPRT
jgi:hypothetical protein